MKSKIRVRLHFSVPPPLLPSAKKYMFLINKHESDSVAQVERDVACKFGFSNSLSISLSIQGCVLVPNDDIEIIRDGDEINVDVGGSVQTPEQGGKIDDQSKELRKVVSDNNPTDNKSKKKHARKRQPSVSLNALEPVSKVVKVDDAQNTNECMMKKPAVQKKNKKKKEQSQPVEKEFNAGNTLDTKSMKTKKEKKHKKKKKQKKSKENMDKQKVQSNNETTMACNDVSSPSSAIFSSPVSTILKYNNHSSSVDNTTNVSDEKIKSATPVKLNNKSLLSSHKSDISNLSILSMKSSSINGFNRMHNKDNKSSQLVDNYDALTNLTWPPRSGDHIAFKLLEMTANYTPEISEFMEAEVMRITGTSPTEATICLNIFWPIQKKSKTVGKFDVVYDEHNSDFEDTEDCSLQTVSWNCLLEPKLIK